MEEISVSQLHEVFSSFIQQLNEKTDDLRANLEFQMGTSSAFSSYVGLITNKIVPICNSLLKNYKLLYKDNIRVSSKYENEIQKSDLFGNAFSEVSTFLTQKEDQYNFLWFKMAEFAELLLHSETDNFELQNKLIDAAELLQSKENKIAELNDEVKKLEERQQWILENFEDVFTTPDLLLNAQTSVSELVNSLHDEKEEKINELEKEISNLKSSIDEINAESKQKEEAQQQEISDLKAKNLSLNETIEKQKLENQKLEKVIEELNKKVSYLSYESEKKEKMESAITEFCDAFPFISFNGTRFDYNAEDVSQQLVLEKTLLSTRKENKDLSSQVNQLRDEIRKSKINYENDLQKNKTSLGFEIDALKLQLKQLNQHYDEAKLESTQLKSNVNKLLSEKLQIEASFKEINKENQELRAKYNDIISREDDHFSRYQASLDKYSEFISGRTALSKSNTTSKLFSYNQPKLFNSSSVLQNSIFTAPVESTPESDILKEANETLQKEKDILKQEKNSLNDKIETLNNSISELKANNNELVQELSDAKDKISSTEKLMNEWKQLYEKLISSNKQAEPLEDIKVIQLEAQLKESHENYQKLQNKYNDLAELNEKQEIEVKKSKELYDEQAGEILELQKELLRKETKLTKISHQLDESKSNSNSNSNDEKDKEISKLREENEEYKKHINLLETQIENNQEKHQQLQQQLKLMTKQVVGSNSIQLDSQDDSKENEHKVTIIMPNFDKGNQKPIPPPEVEEPEIPENQDDENEDHENQDDENNEAETNEADNQEDQEIENHQIQEDDAEINPQNDEEQNDEADTENKQEESQENQNENDNDNNDDDKKEQEQPEPEPEPVKEKEKEKPKETSESQHQYQHHSQQDRNRDQQDRNRDKGRDRSSNYMRRSQSVSSEKQFYQQNKKQPQKSTNTSSSNSQKPKGPPERRTYQKRTNTKRKK